MATLNINSNSIIQSSELFLQAAGSTNSGNTAGIVAGIHLRWTLQGDLGNHHLPKGDLERTTTNGYNNDRDYVEIHRANYSGQSLVSFNLNSNATRINNVNKTIEFDINMSGEFPRTITAQFKFLNGFGYTGGLVKDYLQTYNGTVEFSIIGQLMYHLDINLSGTNLNVEAIKVNGNNDTNLQDAEIIYRQSLSNGTHSIKGENIFFIRFNPNGKNINSISFNTYTNCFHALNGNWTHLGDFSLSNNDTVAMAQLRHNDIHNKWLKYNDNAKVNGFNYQDRWSKHLKEAVNEYILLSKTDTKAFKRFKGTAEVSPQVNLSYLDALKVAALDYHVARMLGLAYIDSEETLGNGNYVYLAKYRKYINGNLSEELLSLSMPTSKSNYRIPPTPSIKPIAYGLTVNKKTNQPIELTDSNGYLPYEPARYININQWAYQLAVDYTTNLFSSGTQFKGEGDTNIRPVSYGVEYRKKGEAAYRKPELNHDSDYNDPSGIAETVTVLAGDNPIYVHKETEAGIHQYRLYSVNWFSRVSALSGQIETDATVFPKPNTLLPPVNLATQYIQKENPRIFTSQSEQNRLQNRINSGQANPNFIRLTFDWNHIHHSVYQSGQFIHFYFRTKAAKNVRGEISAITELGNNQIRVQTKSYTLASINPAKVVSSVINANEVSNYVGSIFAVDSEQYLIEAVQYNSNGAIFTLRKNKNRHIQELVNNDFVALEDYTAPKVGDRFMVIESLSDKTKWTKFNKKVALKAPTTYKEPIVNIDGIATDITFGGITARAEVTEEGEGLYAVTFENEVLPIITDTDVEWYKGIARMPIEGTSERKILDIWSITNEGNTVIHLYDSNPTNNPIQLGIVEEVNFHPGYRVYIYPENEQNTINWNVIEPALTQGSNTTYVSACASDDTITPENQSPLCPPVPMLALELSEPQQPHLPIGPTFATRPDFYGKSSFTFDTNLTSANPYSLIFYRANERAILDRLYKPETVEQIYADLAALGEDEFRVNRWQGLINVEIEGEEFRPYGEYAFPNPDVFPFDGQTPPAHIENEILDAIALAFKALTRQPVVYSYLKESHQTSAEQPTLYNDNRELLTPSDAAFNPFPMACITNADEKAIRFTDYSLDGATKHIYFYCVAEMSDRMTFSARSAVLGPIQLVNTFPPEVPSIKQVLTQMQDDLLNLPVGVRFVLNPYTKTEAAQVKKVRIYRAYNLEDTHTVRTMQLVDTVDYAAEIVDEFNDVTFPPFGETLYYRLVALREIKNENGTIEYVPSKPSKVVMTNIIDAVNPTAPSIREHIGTDLGEELQNVVLEWEKATHNGSYYLYKMNNIGNWVKIYEIKSNANTLQYPPLVGGNPDFTNYSKTQVLDKVDEDDNPIYHRFKVVVENASGLLSLQENVLTV